jgi:hypothetical protein
VGGGADGSAVEGFSDSLRPGMLGSCEWRLVAGGVGRGGGFWTIGSDDQYDVVPFTPDVVSVVLRCGECCGVGG